MNEYVAEAVKEFEAELNHKMVDLLVVQATQLLDVVALETARFEAECWRDIARQLGESNAD